MIEVTAAIEDNRSYNSGEEMLAKLQEIQNNNEKEILKRGDYRYHRVSIVTNPIFWH